MRDRLIGLGLVLGGIGVLALVRLFARLGPAVAAPAPPPGVPAWAAVSPLACLEPLLALGALGLILVGLYRIVSPGP